MSNLIDKNTPAHVLLAPGEILTVTTDGTTIGQVIRLQDTQSWPDVPQATNSLSGGATFTAGPYPQTTRWKIANLVNAFGVSYDIARPAPAHIQIIGDASELREIVGADAPTDGVTGANVAGIGSRYTDVSAANIYLNAGTKASPLWKLVTRAADVEEP